MASTADTAVGNAAAAANTQLQTKIKEAGAYIFPIEIS